MERETVRDQVRRIAEEARAASGALADVYKRQLFALCDGKLEFTKGAKHKVHVRREA